MDILERFTTQNPTSKRLYEEACRYLPSGSSRNVLTYSPFPIYMARGLGSRLWDVDGNERIDFNYNNTTLILGHNHPKVVKAIRDQLENGTVLGAPTEAEVELAGELTRRLGAEKLRFTPSGTEANLQAVRLARSYTGKDLVAKCEGAYHGSWDSMDVSVSPPVEKAGPAKAPHILRQHEGIPQGVLDNILILPFNDAEACEALIKKHREKLAAVILEPVQRDTPPKPGFLEAIREVTSRYGILLIFDEVISFRLSQGGAQRFYGVKPDITTIGKIIGGGFPVGAYASTDEIVKPLTIPEAPFPELKSARLGFSGTFNAHPVTMAAGLAVMKELTPGVYRRLEDIGGKMRKGLTSVLEGEGLGFHAGGVGSFFHINWTEEEIVDYRTAAKEDRILSRCFSLDLMNRGLYLWGHPNVSAATSVEDVDEAIEAIRGSVKALRPIIDERTKQRKGS
ncbi:aspartate aminotransferase family protein [Candidatus Bathyarchaeota archaeon]|nr:aspartate aminotransferase family protein [Candidatus Bathyarchaeota archaeon]